MPRIDTIRFASLGIEIPVQFTSKTGKFTCQYAGVFYEDVQIDPLRSRVLEAIKVGMQAEWLPVIELTLANPESGLHPSVRLQCERLYIAFFPGVGIKTCHWGCPDGDRLKASRDANWIIREAASLDDKQLQLPYKTNRQSSGDHYLLAYSDKVWSQLEEIQTYFKLLCQKLSMHLATQDGITTILENCHRMFDSVVIASGAINHE